jgi:hypothetical protein
MIAPAVSLRYGIWPLTLRDESGLCLRIFGPKREEVTGESIKSHNKEPVNL